MLLVSSHDELSSKFRPAQESHLWFNLGKGSGARRGVHLGAQTQSLVYFWEACSLNLVCISLRDDSKVEELFHGSADLGFV